MSTETSENKWSRRLPDEQGLWWWWNEDEDSAPIIVHIFYSGTDGTYFAPEGQYGWTRFQPVSEMAGYWMRQVEPEMPLWEKRGCSTPGCGYPDGKPCIKCGLVVQPPKAQALERRNSELTARIAELEKELKETGESRDKAFQFATRMEKSEDRFAKLLEGEWDKIAKAMFHEKKLEEGIGDAVARVMTEREALKAALAEARKDSQWQPIETAPEDGAFLVYMPEERESNRIQAARYHPNVKIIGGLFSFDRKPPTHWMPLPATPIPESKGQL